MSLENMPEENLQEAAVESKREMLPEIEAAQTFEELYGAIDKIGSLKGSSLEYSATELKDKVAKAEETPFYLDMVTRTGGLREKVRELIDKKNAQ